MDLPNVSANKWQQQYWNPVLTPKPVDITFPAYRNSHRIGLPDQPTWNRWMMSQGGESLALVEKPWAPCPWSPLTLHSLSQNL